MKIWNVITPDKENLSWAETFRERLFRRFPQVDEHGMIWLEEFPYVFDESACIREFYHERKWAGLAIIASIFIGSIAYLFLGAAGFSIIFVLGIIAAAIIGSPRKEDRKYYWLQDEPAPLVFDGKMTPDTIGITGRTIRAYAKSEHLSRLLQPGTNWKLVAVICLLVGVMAAAVGYSVGISKVIGK